MNTTNTTNATTPDGFEFENDADRKAFIEAVGEIVKGYDRAEVERDQINEICHEIYSKLGIAKSITRKVARLHQQKKAMQFNEEAEMVNALYHELRTK